MQYLILTAAFGEMVLKLNTRDKFIPATKVCASCTKIRKLSSPSSVAVPSQVITAKRFAMANCITALPTVLISFLINNSFTD